ncbi:MAG: TIGR00266 family protein [Spirochaetales bacterium]|nr:TIGR00266 family protein [Spirochaetales bacterium]
METATIPHTIQASPDHAMLHLQLPPGRSIRAEAASMAAMDPSLELTTSARGGFKRLLSGENIFLNTFTAHEREGQLDLAPSVPGDIVHVSLENQALYVQNGAFLACSEGVNVDASYQGLKGFFGGKGLFMARCTGLGDLWFSTYGGIVEIPVEDRYVVDNGYVVAFTEGLDYNVKPRGVLKSFFFSQEGLVTHFSGKGRLWVQTRRVPALVNWADSFRREKTNTPDDD